MEDFERARETMVDTQLRPASITSSALLDAMGRIPREKFVPEQRQSIAYVDVDHQLSASGRALPAAAGFAKLAQLAEIVPTDIVLDIGCGAGYSTAVLASLASAVVGVEVETDLVEKANENLASLEIGNAAVLHGELQDGVPSEAPFDAIVIEGEVDVVPPALIKQLKDHGRLVAMIAKGETATATVFVKTGNDVAVRSSFNANLPKLAALQAQPEFIL